VRAPAVAIATVILVLGWRGAVPSLRARLSGLEGGLLLAAVVALPAAMHAALSRSAGAGEFVAIVIYAFLPVLLLRRGGDRVGAGDWIAWALLYAPVAAGWPLADSVEDPDAAVVRHLLAAALLLVAFVVVRPGMLQGFAWRLRAADAATAAVALAAVLAVAAATAFVSGHGFRGLVPAGWAPGAPGEAGLAPAAWSILATVLSREIAFRGVLFSLLQRAFVTRYGPWPALAVTALVSAAEAVLTGGTAGTLGFALAAWTGAWLAWSVLRTGSLMPALAARAVLETLARIS